MRAENGFVIYCLGWNAWGRGKTDVEAIRNWRAAGPLTGGRRKAGVMLVKAHEDSFVDDEECGVIRTPVGKPRAEKIEDRTVSV